MYFFFQEYDIIGYTSEFLRLTHSVEFLIFALTPTLFSFPRHFFRFLPSFFFFFFSFFLLLQRCSLLPCLSTTCSSSPPLISDSLSLFCRDLPEKERTFLSLSGVSFCFCYFSLVAVPCLVQTRRSRKKKKSLQIVCHFVSLEENQNIKKTRAILNSSRMQKRVFSFFHSFERIEQVTKKKRHSNSYLLSQWKENHWRRVRRNSVKMETIGSSTSVWIVFADQTQREQERNHNR